MYGRKHWNLHRVCHQQLDMAGKFRMVQFVQFEFLLYFVFIMFQYSLYMYMLILSQ